MRLHVPLLGMALAVVLAGCAQEAAPPPDTTAADTEAAREFINQFLARWNTADNAALSQMVADDAVLMQPDGPVLEGPDAILQMIADAYDVAMAQQSATIDEIIILGDYAYTRGTWNVDPTPAAGDDAEGANGKWSNLLKRGADGAWQISRWMWNQEGMTDTAGS